MQKSFVPNKWPCRIIIRGVETTFKVWGDGWLRKSEISSGEIAKHLMEAWYAGIRMLHITCKVALER